MKEKIIKFVMPAKLKWDDETFEIVLPDITKQHKEISLHFIFDDEKNPTGNGDVKLCV